MKKKFNIAVVGATGLIGGKFLKVLEERNFPIFSARLFASEKSEGKTIDAFGKYLTVEKLEGNDFCGIDFAFFSAGKDISLKYAPIFAECGATVIDNSSAFRQNNDVPLVIPEINAEKLNSIKRNIVANPNCSTIIALTPLKNVIPKLGLKRLVFSTYQAVSGSGMKGIKDLLLTRQGFCGKFYPFDIAETFIPEIGEFMKDGNTEEELKMINETRKITGSDVKISATCVRVPVENCHGISVEAETEKPFDLTTIKALMENESSRYAPIPTRADAEGKNEVCFGKLRKSGVFENGFSYFVVGDNTLKGAALNAVEIAEYIAKNRR